MPVAIPNPSTNQAPAPWSFQMATLTGTNLGDITGMTERSLRFGLSAPSTFEGKLDLAHPMMPSVMAYQDFLIKAYRRGALKEVFECQSGELVGNEQEHTVKLTGTNV